VATLVARFAIPVIEGDIRARGVIGRQYGSHEKQGVADSTISQGGMDRSDRLAETGILVIDVRVCDTAIGTGWMRIKCDDLEYLTMLGFGQSVQLELNLELAQIDVA